MNIARMYGLYLKKCEERGQKPLNLADFKQAIKNLEKEVLKKNDGIR